jgi:hypothetical protein
VRFLTQAEINERLLEPKPVTPKQVSR